MQGEVRTRRLDQLRGHEPRPELQPGTCPLPVLGFWGKMTMPNAGIMGYRRYLPLVHYHDLEH